ncbi:LrgB family protein [Clostridium sp.]|uniref:LrgB family protein n=1 Tax=Clostridium sp. TaxID=1506 RepID=UPI001A4C06E9|nr:LrgB family protein [Clostridium sp.]MBK5234993.1 LrgB family protein [Clostridium sp.]
MKDIFSTAIFAVMISLIAFEIGLFINRKTKKAFLNPLLIAIVIVIIVLKILNINLEDYKRGGQLISFLLAPATVVLAVPLYKNFKLLIKNAIPIIAGIFAGCIVSITTIILLSKAFKLDKLLGLSLVPKSVTTPIGIEISKQIGGIPEITVAAIIITGITGAIIGPMVFSALRIKDKVAIGIAMGTSSHALGTAKAMEMGEIEGGMSGIAIGVAGLITVVIAPMIIKIFHHFSII